MYFIVSTIHGPAASGSEKALEASGDVIHTNSPVVVLNVPLKVSMLVTINTWKLKLEYSKEKFSSFTLDIMIIVVVFWILSILIC
jgi:hypothetical protein